MVMMCDLCTEYGYINSEICGELMNFLDIYVCLV